jgi:hypothetical protein
LSEADLRAFAKRAEASSIHGVPMSRGNVPEYLIEEFMAGLREAGLEEPRHRPDVRSEGERSVVCSGPPRRRCG